MEDQASMVEPLQAHNTVPQLPLQLQVLHTVPQLKLQALHTVPHLLEVDKAQPQLKLSNSYQ